MVNQQVLARHWEEVRDLLREKYHRLTEADLPSVPENIDRLIANIHQKTGVSREAVEAFLSDLSDEGHKFAEKLRRKVKRNTVKAKSRARQSALALQDGYVEASDMVRQRPAQSMIAAFGLGMACGLGAAILLRRGKIPTSTPPQTAIERGRASAERIGRHLIDSLAQHAPRR